MIKAISLLEIKGIYEKFSHYQFSPHPYYHPRREGRTLLRGKGLIMA
jgi:hypothetical protein